MKILKHRHEVNARIVKLEEEIQQLKRDIRLYVKSDEKDFRYYPFGYPVPSSDPQPKYYHVLIRDVIESLIKTLGYDLTKITEKRTPCKIIMEKKSEDT